MSRSIRFGEFVREITVQQRQVSYNALTPEISYDTGGKELPYRPSRLQVTSLDVYRILEPYVGFRLKEQVKAVLPLAVYLVLFQVLILKQNIIDSHVIAGGLISVIIGLMMFMEGLKVGLMPFGESIGTTLPAKSKLPVVMIVAFLLGSA